MATGHTSACAHLDLQVNTVIIVVFTVVVIMLSLLLSSSPSLNLINRYMIETANKYIADNDESY